MEAIERESPCPVEWVCYGFEADGTCPIFLHKVKGETANAYSHFYVLQFTAGKTFRCCMQRYVAIICVACQYFQGAEMHYLKLSESSTLINLTLKCSRSSFEPSQGSISHLSIFTISSPAEHFDWYKLCNGDLSIPARCSLHLFRLYFALFISAGCVVTAAQPLFRLLSHFSRFFPEAEQEIRRIVPLHHVIAARGYLSVSTHSQSINLCTSLCLYLSLLSLSLLPLDAAVFSSLLWCSK